MTDDTDQLLDLTRQLGQPLADLHKLSGDTWAFAATLRISSPTLLEIKSLAGRLDDHLQDLDDLIEELRGALGANEDDEDRA